MKIYTGYPGGITKITNDKGFYQTEDLVNVISVYVNQADVTGITYTLALEFLRADGRKTTIYTEDRFASGEATTLTEENVTYDIHNFTLTNTQLAVAGALAFTCYINILNSGVVEKRGVLFNAVSNVRKTVTYSANTIFVVSEDDEDVPIIVADMKTIIETLSGQLASKVNKADIADDLTTNNSNKVLSAKQGKVLKDTIDGVQEELDSIQALENLNNIVGTYAELEALITIGEATEYQLNAKVQVLNDSTHDNNSTLYNLDSLDIENGIVDSYSWRFIGYYDGYNKEQIDEIINDFEQSVTDNFNELSGQLEGALTEQDEKIESLGTLQPSGADTTEHITNKTAPDGIWISTTDGHWYYWDGEKYVDSGQPYQATSLGDESVKYGKISDALKNTISDKKTVNCYTIDVSSSTSGASSGTFWTSDNLSFTKGVTIARISFNSARSGNGTIVVAKSNGENYEIINSYPINFNSGLNNVDLDYYCNEEVIIFLDCVVKYSSGGNYSILGFSRNGNTLTRTTGLNNYNFAVSVICFETKPLNVDVDNLSEKVKKIVGIGTTTTKAYDNFNSTSQIGNHQIWGHSLLTASKNSIIKSVTLKDMNMSSVIIYIVQNNNGILKKIEEHTFSMKKGDNVCNINFYCEKDTIVLFEPITNSAGLKYQNGGITGILRNYTLSGDSFTLSQQLNSWQLYAEMDVISLKENKIGNVLEVSQNGDKDFETINEAINYAYSIESRENPITILVYPGTYKEVCDIKGNHFISILGVNKNDCIIRDDTGVYNNAPIRICGNAYIANLTLIATHNDDPTYETKERNPSVFADTVGSYALHIDDLHEDDDNDYLTVVENCYLYSEQNAAVGIGLQKNMTLKLINCEFVKNVNDAIYNHSVLITGRYGAVFIHNVSQNKYGGNSGYQKFVMDNCRLKVNKGLCFNTQDLGSGGKFTFYYNVLYSDELGKTNVYHNNIPNSLTSDSFGNNIDSMNN